jgi:predicted nucleotidyltransferase
VISPELPEAVRGPITAFTTAARQVFADDLLSVVLFGSAAEGRMRQTSDVNVVVVLRAVDPTRLEEIGEAYRLAHVGRVMAAASYCAKRVRRKGRRPLLQRLSG